MATDSPFHQIFVSAETLHRRISEMAESELREYIDSNPDDVLADIANDRSIKWSASNIHSLAQALKHQSEVVVILDALRIAEEKQNKETK